MRNPLDVLTSALLLRRLVQQTDRIATALEIQNGLLRRLADHVIPELAPASEGDLRDSGPLLSRDRDAEQSRILDFIERFHQDAGREPTEEEVVEWLDEQPQPSIS